jgi:ribosomal protein S12 methylthiotransferase
MVEFIKRHYPQVALRTTFIVGFPGETEADVEDLEQFILEGHFSNVGVFTYSVEKGTPAGERDDQIPEKEREQRRKRIMKAQQRVVQDHLQSFVGTRQRVLIEGPHEDTDLLLAARASFQAAEVDGIIMINDSQVELASVQAGQFASVEITDVVGYDLMATVLQVEDSSERGVAVGALPLEGHNAEEKII